MAQYWSGGTAEVAAANNQQPPKPQSMNGTRSEHSCCKVMLRAAKVAKATISNLHGGHFSQSQHQVMGQWLRADRTSLADPILAPRWGHIQTLSVVASVKCSQAVQKRTLY